MGDLVWGVKIDFTHKSSWTLVVNKTLDPIVYTYYGFVSRESVQIAFTYDALNVMDIFSANIRGSYLQAPVDTKRIASSVKLNFNQECRKGLNVFE